MQLGVGHGCGSSHPLKRSTDLSHLLWLWPLFIHLRIHAKGKALQHCQTYAIPCTSSTVSSWQLDKEYPMCRYDFLFAPTICRTSFGPLSIVEPPTPPPSRLSVCLDELTSP